jgi:hypothetical protein
MKRQKHGQFMRRKYRLRTLEVEQFKRRRYNQRYHMTLEKGVKRKKKLKGIQE